jgi:integrase
MKTNEQVKALILDKARAVMRRKHMALATERAYCGWIGRFYDFCLDLPKDMDAEMKMERFLTMLATVHDVSASTQNGAFHGIRFLYTDVIPRELDISRVNALRATRPDQIRHAPSVEDTIALLQDVRDIAGYPSSLVTRMLYGSGLRVSEPLELRIKDVRLDRRELYILGAKGRKDRVVRLPEVLIPDIERQIAHAYRIWDNDQRQKLPVTLPHQLAKKYPE